MHDASMQHTIQPVHPHAVLAGITLGTTLRLTRSALPAALAIKLPMRRKQRSSWLDCVLTLLSPNTCSLSASQLLPSGTERAR